MRTVRDLILRIRDQGVAGTTKNVDGLLGKTSKLGPAWAAAGKAGTVALGGITVAAVGATAATTAAIASLVSTGAQVEQYQIQLKTVTRDAERAAELLGYLREFGKRTPFELPGLIESAIQLESFGWKAEETMEIVGDSAAAMGKDFMQAALAFTQGTMGEMEMLKQFTITSAQIREQLGHEIDRSTKEGMRETGEAILAIMRDKFGGGMKEMSTTWRGMVSNMQDAWWNFKADLAAGGMFDSIKTDLEDVLKAIDEFSEAGGVDAIAYAFNNAFKTIHDTFFAPLFDNLDTADMDMRLFAVSAETSLLNVAKSAVEVTRTFEILFAMLKKGYDESKTHGIPVYTTLKQIQAGLDAANRSGERIDILNARLAELDIQAKILRGEGIDPATTSLLEFAKAAKQIADMPDTLKKRITYEFEEPATPFFGPPEKFAPEFVGPKQPTKVPGAIVPGPQIPAEVYKAYQKTLEGVFGSAEQARQSIADLYLIAGRTDIDMTGLVKATKQLEDFHLYSKENISSLAQIATESNKSIEDIAKSFAESLQFEEKEDPFLAGIEARKQAELDYINSKMELEQEWMTQEEAFMTQRMDYDRIYFDSSIELATQQAEYKNELALSSSQFYVSQQEWAFNQSRKIYDSLLKYQVAYAVKGANLGRITNSLLIRGAGEVAKAMIDSLTRVSKIKAMQYLADSLSLLAMGDISGAATMAAAAAKHGIVAGLGAVANQMIEQAITSREEALTGRIDTMPALIGTEETTTRGIRKGAASTVRTGPQINNFYITVTNNIDGDYNVNEGQLTDAEQIQELFNQGLVVVPS